MKGNGMLIESLFKKKIDRYISGVVKVQDLDQTKTFQELDEYVVTSEVDRLLNDFFSAFNRTLASPTEDMGVWISGFFGSGKSHFLKVLYYLLTNKKVTDPESKVSRLPYEIFKDKDLESFLTAEIHRAATAFQSDTILFNVQSKEKPADGKHAVLNVFLRVFNEMQGFYEAQPWIAELERQLRKKGAIDSFKASFSKVSGKTWEESREAVVLHKKETVKALTSSLNVSPDEADAWLSELKNKYSVSPEDFSNLVKEYLESKGPQARVVFLVDEVGQFIGDRTDLMLSLQTITEDLGVKCRGKAWVIVTSQEELDSVIGDLNRKTVNDFSKIQGRFKTRLSLSSANVDRVIKTRILDKTEEASAELTELYAEKEAILKNLLSFSSDAAVMPHYEEAEDFAATYPFAPYQFALLQKAYTEIRKTGATGKHLAHGERSMIDGFQSAAVAAAKNKDQVGVLVPFYAFYDSIENSLDGSIKATITRATGDHNLSNPFDTNLLKLLLLIKGLDKEVPPTVENLATLCVTKIDEDKLQLKKEIEAALQRLEKIPYIRRNDDLYYFLTDDEQEIQREVGRTEFDSSRAAKELANIIFDEIIGTKNSYRYPLLKRDYKFNRVCDNFPLDGNREPLSFNVVTPFCDAYHEFVNSGVILCGKDSTVIVRIEQNDRLEREFTAWLKTQIFCERPTGSVSDARRFFVTDLETQNRQRRKRLVTILTQLLTEASVFTCGKSWSTSMVKRPRDLFDQSFAYMVENTFTKLSLIKATESEPEKEITSILTEKDGSSLFVDSIPHAEATKEVLAFIESQTRQSKVVYLNDLVDRFASIPYGWPEWEVVLIVARLVHRGECTLASETPLSKKEAIPYLTKKTEWKKVKVGLRQKVSSADLAQTVLIAKELFSGATPPNGEDAFFNFFQEKLRDLHEELKTGEGQIILAGYPGKDVLAQGITLMDRYLAQRTPGALITTLLGEKDSIKSFQEAYEDVKGFLKNQTKNWNDLKDIVQRYTLNAWFLDPIPEAKSIVEKAQSILSSSAPYSQLKESSSLSKKFGEIEDTLIKEHRTSAFSEIEKVIKEIKDLACNLEINSEQALNQILRPLTDLRGKTESTTAIAELKNATQEADRLGETQARELRNLVKPKPGEQPKPQREQIVIDPRSAWERGQLIQGEEDIKKYLDQLRILLLEAIKKGDVSLR